MNKEKDNIIVFDIETQTPIRSNQSKSQLRVSVTVAYFYKDDSYKVYDENDIDELIQELKGADLVVGFNLKGFDYPVLENYSDEPLGDLPTLDILEEVYNSLGRRIKLDYLAEATLNNKKTANGLMAVKFWENGQIEKLVEYCKHDVRLTKELYDYGQNYGYLLYKNFDKLERISISWSKIGSLKVKLNKAFLEKKTINIYYTSSSTGDGEVMPQKRLIDIYYIDEDQIVAFCHLRRAWRTFNIRRILDIRPTNKKYKIAEDFDIDTYRKYF